MIVGISGKMQSGKNTVASIIQYLTHEYELHGQITQSFDNFSKLKYDNSAFTWKQVAFATKLKEIVSILTGISVEDLEKQEVKDKVLGQEWWKYGIIDYFKGTTEEYSNFIRNNDVRITDRAPYRMGDKLTFTFIWNTLKPTVRQLLQEIGTNDMRDVIHPNIWVNALFADYKNQVITEGGESTANDGGYYSKPSYREYPNWIITDLRFKNEKKAIKDRGGITVRVNRYTGHVGIDNDTHVVTDWQHPSETALDLAQFKYTIDNNGTIEELIQKVKDILIKEKLI